MSKKNRKYLAKNNPVFLAYPVAVLGITTWKVILGVAAVATVTALYKSSSLAPVVDTSVLDKLASRQDYVALANLFTKLTEKATEGHVYNTFEELKAATDTSVAALTLPPESVVAAYLQASIFLMESYLLSGNKLLYDRSLEIFNKSTSQSMNPQKAPQLISEILQESYKLIIGTPFKDQRSKFHIAYALAGVLDAFGIKNVQLDQQHIDQIVAEEALMAACNKEKPLNAILAALRFQKKPICITDEEWLYIRLGTYGGVLAIVGGILSTPLRVASSLGEALGTAVGTAKDLSSVPKMKIKTKKK